MCVLSRAFGSDPISEEGSGEGSLLSSAPLPSPMPSEEHLTAEGQGMGLLSRSGHLGLCVPALCVQGMGLEVGHSEREVTHSSREGVLCTVCGDILVQCFYFQKKKKSSMLKHSCF